MGCFGPESGKKSGLGLIPIQNWAMRSIHPAVTAPPPKRSIGFVTQEDEPSKAGTTKTKAAGKKE